MCISISLYCRLYVLYEYIVFMFLYLYVYMFRCLDVYMFILCLYGYICLYVILCLYTAEASDLISPRTLRIVPWDFLWGGLHSIPGRPEKKWKSWTHKLHQIAIGINKVLLPFANSGSLRGFCPYRFWGGLGQAGAPAQIGCIGGFWKYLEVLRWLPEGSRGMGRFRRYRKVWAELWRVP